MTIMLTEAFMSQPPYLNEWPKVLTLLLSVLEGVDNPILAPNSQVEEEEELEIEELSGYSTCSKLNYASKDNVDPFKHVPDAKQFLAIGLHNLSKQAPGKFGPLIATIPPDAQTILATYFKMTNPPLPEPFIL